MTNLSDAIKAVTS